MYKRSKLQEDSSIWKFFRQSLKKTSETNVSCLHMKCRKPKLNIKQYKLIVKKHKIDIILSDVYLECMILKCKRGVQNCCSTKEIVRRARKDRTIFSTINNFIRYKYWCLDKPKPYICIVYRRSMYCILLLSPIILLQLPRKR